jgi:hypothetical protein
LCSNAHTLKYIHIFNVFEQYRTSCSYFSLSQRYSERQFLSQLSSIISGITSEWVQKGPVTMCWFLKDRVCDTHMNTKHFKWFCKWLTFWIDRPKLKNLERTVRFFCFFVSHICLWKVKVLHQLSINFFVFNLSENF